MRDMYISVNRLDEALESAPKGEMSESAKYFRDTVLPIMRDLRKVVDRAELITDAKDWPYPTYGEMLFSVM